MEQLQLVTGGNSAIGLTTAKEFVGDGAYVFITGRRENVLTKAVQEITCNRYGSLLARIAHLAYYYGQAALAARGPRIDTGVNQGLAD
jgi:NADP-dependent 3-hydroxy acid dehydrogenase YdfG